MQKPEAEHASLEEMAMVSLEFGRLLMECGASARVVDELVATVARGLGAERVDLRIGYASLAVTVVIGSDTMTRMRNIGPLGVNQRLDHSVRELAGAVGRGEFTVATARSRLVSLVQESSRHPGWLVDIAVGAACAGGDKPRIGGRWREWHAHVPEHLFYIIERNGRPVVTHRTTRYMP